MAEKDEFFLPEDIDRQIEDVKQSKEGDQSDAEALVYLSSYYQADALHQQETLERIWNRIAAAPLLQQNIQENRKKRPMQNSQSYNNIEAIGVLRGARSQRPSLFHRLSTLVAAVLLVALLGGMTVVLYNIRQHAGTSSPNSNSVITTAHGCTTAVSCQKAIVTVTPNQVQPGGKVTVTVKGWVANAKLQASIGTQALDSNIVSATSDARGNFSVTLTINQPTDIGPTTIHINLANTKDVSKNLTVPGKLTIIQSTGGCTTAVSCQRAIVTVTPNQVQPGGKVTVTVKGWVANANLQASIGAQALDSNIVSATSDARGNFSVTLTINQPTDIGPTTIHINLANTKDVSKNLTVPGKLTIIQSTGGCTTAASCQQAIVTATPNQVQPGGKVTVTGTGWVANANLQASIGAQALDSNIVSATSDAQGNFSVTLTINQPTDIGPTTIHINLADTTDGSKNLTVPGKLTIIQSTGGCTTAASCQQAIVTATPNQVKAGGKVTVTGTGWVANANLQASIGTQALDSNIVSATSDAQGNFSVTLTINQITDIGPTTIHINLVNTGDGSKNLTVQGKLTIIK